MTMKLRSIATSLALLGCVCVVTAGCSFSAGILVPSSHFVYPNSNVEPLGTVSASLSKTQYLFVIGRLYLEKNDLSKLYDNAVAQKGGDVLINVRFDAKVTSFPLPIVVAKYSVTGTAAKMTVGQQAISQLRDDALRSLEQQAAGLKVDVRGEQTASLGVSE